MSIKEIVRQDDTWMALDPVVGCVKNCQYCFLQTYGMTPRQSEIIAEPKEAVDKLLSFPTYHPDSVIMFGSETDAFMNRKNIDYFKKLIDELSERKIPNSVAMVTKCHIPDDFIKFAKETDVKILFYISYSGLSKPIEPTTKREDLKNNFIRLKSENLPTVHYWRPFISGQTTMKVINDVIKNVVPYADCSMISGLKINDGIIDKLKSYWPELERFRGITDQIGSVWPKGARNYVRVLHDLAYYDYPLYWTNSCAVSHQLKRPDFNAFWGSIYCKNSNCPPDQRKICSDENVSFPKPDEVILKQSLDKLKIKGEYEITNNSVLIDSKLSHSETVYLRQRINFPIIASGYTSTNEWSGVVLQRPDIEI